METTVITTTTTTTAVLKRSKKKNVRGRRKGGAYIGVHCTARYACVALLKPKLFK